MEIDAQTVVVGIFGYPLRHTLSPAMQNAAFRAKGLNFVYLPFEVLPEEIGNAVKAIRALGMKGVNVTVPHKEAVIPFLDSLSAEAELVGAVNTIVREGKELKGYNTDCPGFLRALEETGFEVQGKRAVILGAGGAARAVAVALAKKGVGEIAFLNRTPSRAERLAALINTRTSCPAFAFGLEERVLARLLPEAEIVVQATSYGMHPAQTSLLIPPHLFSPGALVCELVYNPPQTAFLAAAAARGCKLLPGKEMLIYQGAIAFELWTGLAPPVEVMRESVEAILEGRRGC